MLAVPWPLAGTVQDHLPNSIGSYKGRWLVQPSCFLLYSMPLVTKHLDRECSQPIVDIELSSSRHFQWIVITIWALSLAESWSGDEINRTLVRVQSSDVRVQSSMLTNSGRLPMSKDFPSASTYDAQMRPTNCFQLIFYATVWSAIGCVSTQPLAYLTLSAGFIIVVSHAWYTH